MKETGKTNIFIPGSPRYVSINQAVDQLQEYSPASFHKPVQVAITYGMPRPKSHYRGSRLRPEAPRCHDRQPSLAELDETTIRILVKAGFLKNLGQAWMITSRKVWVSHHRVGTVIQVVDA